MNTIELMLSALKSLRHAYLNLLESGCECILDLGGTCDPVDVMEDRDLYLASAVKAIAAGEQELEREPTLYQFRSKAGWVNDWSHWDKCSKESAGDFEKTPMLHDWHYEVRRLYTREETK